MSWYHPTNLFDKVFEGGIILKGIDGALEFVGGLLAVFISPAALQHFISFVTQRELVEDPHDKIAAILIHATSHYAESGRIFLIIYLWIHAAIKLTAVIGILKNKLWAYPFSLITLGLLILYQLYDMAFIKLSAGMAILTALDLCILWLIWREYGKIRQTQTETSPE